MIARLVIAVLAANLSCVGFKSVASATERSIILQSTTSTKNSGLYKYLLPIFTAKTGITVHVVAVGTGQALKNARNCDGDVLLVHAKAAELKFVAAGSAARRYDLMYNDFVIVGPAKDPAAIAGKTSAGDALKNIAKTKSLFASRGDESGTHKKERALWQGTGIDLRAASGKWYRALGQGMGATLNAAVAMGAYVLTDRATWLAFRNKGTHTVLVQGDPALFNQYGVLVISKQKCPASKHKLAKIFVSWLLSNEGQAAIARYRKHGRQLFFPNAHKNR